MASLILKGGRDFTPVGLKNWINKNLSHKLAEKKKISVNTGDVHQYILKGKLPIYFGNYKITSKYNAEIGLKYVELELID